MSFIDFAALKAAVKLDQAAQTLGLELKQEGSQFRTACPACKSGGDRAIVLTPAKGLFYCFSAKKGGDCIALAAHVMGVGNNDAANFLADQVGTCTSTVPDKDTSTTASQISSRLFTDDRGDAAWTPR
jgi:DNA primase